MTKHMYLKISLFHIFLYRILLVKSKKEAYKLTSNGRSFFIAIIKGLKQLLRLLDNKGISNTYKDCDRKFLLKAIAFAYLLAKKS